MTLQTLPGLRLNVAEAEETPTNREAYVDECVKAYDALHRDGAHGEVTIIFVDGEADRLKRTTSTKLPRVGKRSGSPPA